MPYSPEPRQSRLLQLNGSSQPLHNSLSRKNRTDLFDVSLPSVSSFRASLNGIAKKANVDLALINQKGTIVASSHKRGRAAELIAVENLEAGNYKLRASLKRGEKTKYQLSFNSTPRNIVLDAGPISNPEVTKPDLGGNSMSSATNWGQIGSNVSTIADRLGPADGTDWFTFTVGESGLPSSRLNLALTGDAGVFANIYSATDLNSSLGSIAAYSGNQFKSHGSTALTAGTYLLKVSPVSGNSVNYKLNLWAEGLADNAGNTQATARVINGLQPLNKSSQPVSFTDFVGHGDIFDNYTFKTDTKTILTITFDRLNSDNPNKARILHQLDKIDGSSPTQLYWKNSQGASLSGGFEALTSPSYTLSGELEPGTYNLQLKSYFHDGDNSYRVSFSTQP